ncbi:efflux RND transporter periplasmic adaptor subunit [Mesoterricola silvestris]|nr:efflux RND transporter periplasmic adaptor subunit [Mesoterricola silvestris]
MNRYLIPWTAVLLVACGRGKDPKPADARVPVAVAQPTHTLEFEQVTVSGTLSSPGNASTVAFLVPGRTLRVMPREGEPVRKGQVLAELDAENLRHALEAAHAQTEAAAAGARQAEQEFGRMKQLHDSRSLAPNDFAKFTAARDAAAQQLRQAQAGEAAARRNLDDARLVAPIGGYLSRRLVEPGVMVAPGQPAFEISPLDPVEVNVGVPETDVRLVKVGQAASVRVPALPGRFFQGRVKVVNVSADPATRTYMTRISVPNPGKELKLGMVAEVAISGTRKLDMLSLPMGAIVRDAQGATLVYQFFPDQGRVYSKRVEAGQVLGTRIQIRSGLLGTEPIVVAGQNGLRDGMDVRLAPEGK